MACALLGTVKEIPHLTNESQRGRKRGGLVVTGPGWTDRPAEVRDTELYPGRPIREGHLRPGFQLSRWDRRDGDPQTFAS